MSTNWSSSRTNSSGWSRCGKWPLSGSTVTVASGASAATLLECRTGMTWSSRPHTTAIGIVSVR